MRNRKTTRAPVGVVVAVTAMAFLGALAFRSGSANPESRLPRRYRLADLIQRQQQEMMALYGKEKINPMMGCVPMLIQIPIFYSLYKVLTVTIEMRQAPFFGKHPQHALTHQLVMLHQVGHRPVDIAGHYV